MIDGVLLLAILGPAVAMGGYIVVDSQIAFPIRRFVVDRFGEEHPITTLLHCIYCTSVWLGIAAAIYSWLFLDLHPALIAPVAFAASCLGVALYKLMR